jgi:NAD-dependent SIR2 family protein deacetylase
VQAGIPDFRSPEGLFQTVKRDNPKEALASGKDLFDASVFNVSILFLSKIPCQRRTATSIAHHQLPIV